MTRDWGRLLTAMVTPFDADLEVNYKEARRVAAYLVDDMQNDGLVVSGTTGESPTLSETEKLRLLEEVLDEVGDRAAVVFGAGSYDTRESIHMTKEADKRGAHGIMIVNPYYNKPGQDGLYAHFHAIAKETTSPVMVYNIMPRSAINLETDTLMRLAELPNIKAVKEASGDLGQISDVCRRKPAGFRVYSGDDALTLPILALGGHGLVSVAAHIVGREYNEMIESFESDPARARALHHQVTPLVKAMFRWPSPTPVKYALSLRGFDTTHVRLPLVEINEEAKSFVKSALA
jgi:4-hydroxy-tetrahydrodipicolinate synthase